MRSRDLEAYLDRELDGPDRASLDHAFRRSRELVEKLAVQEGLKKAVQSSLAEERVPDPVRVRLLARLWEVRE